MTTDDNQEIVRDLSYLVPQLWPEPAAFTLTSKSGCVAAVGEPHATMP
jgi:hypothetical protein